MLKFLFIESHVKQHEIERGKGDPFLYNQLKKMDNLRLRQEDRL